ncbi:MAG: ATP-binding protein [Hyphomicrobiales bacterium]|nr:ATP-binding protein [Hyphomicrobiales bacterium]
MVAEKKGIVWILAVPLPIVLMCCLLIAAVFLPGMIIRNTTKTSVDSAIQTVKQIKTFRTYYANNVVKKVVAKGVLVPSYDHADRPDGIPLPATLVHDLSALLRKEKTSVLAYSEYPFEMRKDRQLDEHQRAAWAFLVKNPDDVFSREETRGGQRFLRVAVADKMASQTCVDCHNKHPASLKTDWKLGDVRGVMEVVMNIDDVVAGANELKNKILLGMLIVGLLLIALIVVGARTIASPIVHLTGIMKRLAEGDLSAEIPSKTRIAEIGQMKDAVLVFKENAFKRQLAEAEIIRHRDHLQDMVETATMDLKAKAVELNRALTREKRLNEQQRQFVSMASHEFRTPLAVIDGMAQRLKRLADKGPLAQEDAAERVDKIRGAVARMTRLMESTLAAARMDEGKINIEIAPCTIRDIVEEVCIRQQEIATDHVISCNATALPPTIQADSGALEQVLTNLLSNAVKYAPDAPDIQVRAHSEGDDVVISVRDNEVGIDEDDLPRMFERFFRAKSSTGISGTGIGLNVVKTLIEMHDGSINFESAIGEGTTFTVRLPINGPVKRLETVGCVA